MTQLESQFADAIELASLGVVGAVALIAAVTVVAVVAAWFWRQLAWLDGQNREAERKALKVSAERFAPTYTREGWQAGGK